MPPVGGESEETRFLGLRGLVNQAMKEGNRAAALEYLRQAKELRPKTPWVLTNLFELSRGYHRLAGLLQVARLHRAPDRRCLVTQICRRQ